MAHAPRRAQPGEPRQPARGRQEREALVVRQPAVRLVRARSSRPTCSRRSIRTTTRRSARWTTSTRRRSRTSSAFFRTYYAPNNAVLSVVGDVETGRRPCASGRAVLRRRSRRTRTCPPLGDLSLPPTLGGERREVGPRPRARCRAIHVGLPGARLRRPAPRRPRPRRPDPRRAARAAGSTGGSSATSGSPRTSRSSRSASPAAHRSTAGWATVRPGVDRRARRGGASSRSSSGIATRARQRRRARAGQGADRVRRARAPCSGSRSEPTGLSMYATLFDDPGPHQPDAAALPRRDARGRSATCARDGLPARQPGGPAPTVPAKRPATDDGGGRMSTTRDPRP